MYYRFSANSVCSNAAHYFRDTRQAYMRLALKIYSARYVYYRFSALITSARTQPITFATHDKHICHTIYPFALSLSLSLFPALFRFLPRSFSHSLTHSHSLTLKGDDDNNININNNDDDVS